MEQNLLLVLMRRDLMIKGLLVEDDQDNIDSYTKRFKLQEIELVNVMKFPKSAADFWNIVLDRNVDFIIIDNHLHKKCVEYTGLDVLREIRKQDSEIYIIYLTSKGIDKTDPVLSNFDLEVDKLDFSSEFMSLVKRIKRAYSRDIAYKFEREIDEIKLIQQNYYDEQLRIIKEKLG